MLTVKATQPDTESVGRFNVTVDDGETKFTQRFGVIVTGDASAIPSVYREDADDEVVRREFFTLDGRQVRTPQTGGIYLMKVTTKTGTTRSVKVLKRN